MSAEHLNNHITRIRKEYGATGHREYLIKCSCGWYEKAQAWADAEKRADHHKGSAS